SACVRSLRMLTQRRKTRSRYRGISKANARSRSPDCRRSRISRSGSAAGSADIALDTPGVRKRLHRGRKRSIDGRAGTRFHWRRNLFQGCRVTKPAKQAQVTAAECLSMEELIPLFGIVFTIGVPLSIPIIFLILDYRKRRRALELHHNERMAA